MVSRMSRGQARDAGMRSGLVRAHLPGARACIGCASRRDPLRGAAPETAVLGRYGESLAPDFRVTQGRYHPDGAKCESAAKLSF